MADGSALTLPEHPLELSGYKLSVQHKNTFLELPCGTMSPCRRAPRRASSAPRCRDEDTPATRRNQHLGTVTFNIAMSNGTADDEDDGALLRGAAAVRRFSTAPEAPQNWADINDLESPMARWIDPHCPILASLSTAPRSWDPWTQGPQPWLVTAESHKVLQAGSGDEATTASDGDQSSPNRSCCTNDHSPTNDERAESPGIREGPVSLWKRMSMPEKGIIGNHVARRWSRMVGKMFAQEMGAVPLENGVMTSIGSLAHAVSKPCRPCLFVAKGKGCFDGVFCKFCHFSCDHKEDEELAAGRRAKTRRRPRARNRRTDCGHGYGDAGYGEAGYGMETRGYGEAYGRGYAGYAGGDQWGYYNAGSRW